MSAQLAVVIGGHGYLGRLISDGLDAAGWQVQVVSRTGDTRHGRPSIALPALRDLVTRQPAVTIVSLLAGDRHDEPRVLREVVAMLPAAVRVRFVHASSCSVYGAAGGVCREDAPVQPINPYAVAKAAAETVAVGAFGEHLILRIATVHGHDQAGEKKQSVHRLLWQAAGGTVQLYGARAWRPFIERRQAAQVVVSAVCRPELSGVLNIAQDHATFGAVAGYAAGLFGAAVQHLERADGRDYQVDTAAAQAQGLLRPQTGAGLWESMRAYAKAVVDRNPATASGR
ncbi:SDR family oxidoreductase [Actinoplanes sp. NBRC 103695]|uniref:NAD-dependent epimerase/dehydratase family protein n=1 Tax=Actinoplanes sp. NBRC 103695 TaxID=3032202 RepID=UPI0024A5726E|nr:SDR family oxidoreductase [Actinoplanes sp. NBRC 103695]GLY99831.1 NAD-dependent dehydratase [Actinoplanes sp. NBRC 103695]